MTHFTDKPCAAHGLKSYRYKGSFGFILIGATDDQDALKEAQRSLSSGIATIDRLQSWCFRAGKYQDVLS